MEEQQAKKSSVGRMLITVLPPVAVMIVVIIASTNLLSKIVDDPEQAKQALPVIAAIGGAMAAVVVGYIFFRSIVGLQQESRSYAENISRRGAVDFSLRLGPIQFRRSRVFKPLLKTADNEEPTAAVIEKVEPSPIDASSPNALFKFPPTATG